MRVLLPEYNPYQFHPPYYISPLFFINFVQPSCQPYSRVLAVGCIVDAVGVNGCNVPREFTSVARALRYLKGILTAHDKLANKKRTKPKKLSDMVIVR